MIASACLSGTEQRLVCGHCCGVSEEFGASLPCNLFHRSATAAADETLMHRRRIFITAEMSLAAD